MLLGNSYLLVKDLKEFKGFDPYEILEIDKRAIKKKVKSAYRKLSKTMHPDNPYATEDFLKLAKAHWVSMNL